MGNLSMVLTRARSSTSEPMEVHPRRSCVEHNHQDHQAGCLHHAVEQLHPQSRTIGCHTAPTRGCTSASKTTTYPTCARTQQPGIARHPSVQHKRVEVSLLHCIPVTWRSGLRAGHSLGFQNPFCFAYYRQVGAFHLSCGISAKFLLRSATYTANHPA